jgi:hypothetical protein
MPNVSEDRENHQVNFIKGSYTDLCAFRKAYNYDDNGQAIKALLDNYRQVFTLRKQYEDELVKIEVKQRDIADYEQLLIRESALSQTAFQVIRQVTEEEGVSPEDLEAACQLLRVAGVSLPDLVQQLAKFGGMKNYIQTLTDAIQHLESEQQAIVDRKAKQCTETSKARMEYERLLIQQQKAREQIESAMGFAQMVTKSYESLNIVLGDIIGKVLAGGYSVMDLPAEAMDVLVGVIMMLRLDMYGDREFVLQPRSALQRLAKVKVDLSEIPQYLAPAEFYREFTARLSLIDGSNGESHMDDSPGIAQVGGV